MSNATMIESSRINEYGLHVTATSGKTTASVSVYSWGVQVCKQNASHRVWRGGGRQFQSLEQAEQGYKSSSMKSIIQAVRDISQASA